MIETIITTVTDTFNSMWGVFKTIGLNDIVDIAILYFLIYNGIKLIRETRAQQLTKGILVLVFVYVLSVLFNLQTLRFILKLCFQWGFLALIILFQPELRRLLEKVGRTRIAELNFFGSSDMLDKDEKWRAAIDVICDSAQSLSSTKTGALIICERKTKLGEQIATGTVLNCTPSTQIFGNIFYPNTPLHDGAVIVRDGMILAAGCFLPRPQKDELINKQLGSRHRAAIGMSENSDALVIVVSEETGAISVAENGELTRGYSRESLRKLLIEGLIPESEEAEPKDNSIAGRVISKWRK